MKLEDLYLELGRAMTEKVIVGQESKQKQDDLQKQVQILSNELQSERDRTRNRQERIQNHVDELQESIRLASEGMDPTLAKLTAKESLEERRKIDELAKQNNTTYGGYGTGVGGSYTFPATYNTGPCYPTLMPPGIAWTQTCRTP